MQEMDVAVPSPPKATLVKWDCALTVFRSSHLRSMKRTITIDGALIVLRALGSSTASFQLRRGEGVSG